MTGVAGMTKFPGGRIVNDEDIIAVAAQESVRDSYLALASATGVTYTPSQMLDNQYINRTGAAGGAIADTLPLGVDLAAAMDAMGLRVGKTFRFGVRNNVGQVITITTNTGWTLTGTMSIASAVTKEFLVERTGAATFEIISLGAGGAV